MVDILYNVKGKNSVTYDVATNQVIQGGFNNQDLAGQSGLSNMADQLNAEGQEFDQQLREEQDAQLESMQQDHYNQEDPQHDALGDISIEDGFEEQEEVRQPSHKKKRTKPFKKSRSQDRFEDLAAKVAINAHERDLAYERINKLEQEATSALMAEQNKNKELQKAFFEMQTKLQQADIKTATDIMFEARNRDDQDLEKEAFGTLTALENEKLRSEERLRILKHHENEYVKPEIDPRETLIYENFDKKELRSDSLEDWLGENPDCNPLSAEFDYDYFNEVSNVKKNLNKWLRGQRRHQIIGEQEYYDLLDNALDIHFGRTPQEVSMSQAPYDPYARRTNQNYSQQQKPVQRATVEIPLHNEPFSPVASVNRAGYRNGAGPHVNATPLNPLERMVLSSMEFYDPISGQPINDPVLKEQMYKLNRIRG